MCFGRFSASLAGFYSESENGTTFDADLNIVKQPERIRDYEERFLRDDPEYAAYLQRVRWRWVRFAHLQRAYPLLPARRPCAP